MTDIKLPPMPKAHTVVKPKDSEPFGLITTRDALNFAAEAVRLNATVPDGIPLNIIRKWPDGFNDRLQHVWLDVVSFIPSVKLYDLQLVLAEFGLRMEVYEDAPAAPQPAQPLDLGVMELAESVGLIGPASRTDDLHEAIQRFHDLIVVNASIKAARHFADGLAQQPLTDEHKAILKECRNQAMKWTVDARIPEAGAFGGIAQDLDYLCAQLGVKND